MTRKRESIEDRLIDLSASELTQYILEEQRCPDGAITHGPLDLNGCCSWCGTNIDPPLVLEEDEHYREGWG